MGEALTSADRQKFVDDKLMHAINHASSSVDKRKLMDSKKIKQVKDMNLTKTYNNEYERVAEIEEQLPPICDEIWNDSLQSMKLFQGLLGSYFNIEESEENITCEAREPIIDLWQLAATIPLLRVDELLVIAGTGTGKSWVMSETARMFIAKEYTRLNSNGNTNTCVRRNPKHIVYLLKGDKAKQSQYVEFMKNSGIQQMVNTYFSEKDKVKFNRSQSDPGQNPIVDADFNPSTGLRKIVTFITYAQAGNLLINKGDDVFDDALLIVDEIHEIQTAAEASGATWKKAVERFELYLHERKHKDNKGMLLGLTATPYKNIPGFVRLMNYFCPLDVQELTEEEFDANEDIPAELYESMNICSLNNTFHKRMQFDRLYGFRVVFYSIDLSDKIYAQWSKQPNVVKLEVPTDRSEDDVDWIKKIAKTENKQYLAGHKQVGVEQKKNWTEKRLAWHGRQRSIAISAADYVAFSAREKGLQKTLVLFPTEVGAATFSKFIQYNLPEIQVIHISNYDTKNIIAEKKHYFDVGFDDTMLVTNIDKFGTGHTFADPELLAAGESKGPKEIIYVQPSTYAVSIQAEGRARRRCLHAGWNDPELTIQRTIILPVAVVEDNLQDTCYSVMKEVTDIEQVFVESIDPAVFMASYTKLAFWSRRPFGLLNAQPGDLDFKFTPKQRKQYKSLLERLLNFLIPY